MLTKGVRITSHTCRFTLIPGLLACIRSRRGHEHEEPRKNLTVSRVHDEGMGRIETSSFDPGDTEQL
jgi:hypothetical protein